MKNRFTLGAVTGMAALTLAVPVFAQMAGSATTSSTGTVTADIWQRPIITQESIQTIVERDDVILNNIDAFVPVIKDALQTHRDAMSAAATITDDADRQEAVHAAHQTMHETIRAAIESNPELKNAFPMMGFMKMHHRGPHPEMLAEKLDMTADELKAALDAGKTIEEIAAERGIDLPARKPGRMMRGMHPPMGDAPINEPDSQ